MALSSWFRDCLCTALFSPFFFLSFSVFWNRRGSNIRGRFEETVSSLLPYEGSSFDFPRNERAFLLKEIKIFGFPPNSICSHNKQLCRQKAGTAKELSAFHHATIVFNWSSAEIIRRSEITYNLLEIFYEN